MYDDDKIFIKVNFCYLNIVFEENILYSYICKIDKRKSNFCLNNVMFSLNNDLF